MTWDAIAAGLRLLSLNRLTAGQTETQVAEAVRRGVAAAGRRPTEARVAPPAAAAIHAERARPISAPLEQVAVHVVQAPWVGLFRSNLVGVFLASIESVAVKPRILAQI